MIVEYEKLALFFPAKINYQIEKGQLESQLQKWDSSVKTFSKIIELAPTNKEARLNRAYGYFVVKKYKESIEDYTVVITTLKDSSGEVYYYRALAYFKNKQTNLGRSDLEKAKNLGFAIPKEIQDKFVNKR